MQYYSTMYCELLAANVTTLMFNKDYTKINKNVLKDHFCFDNKADLPHHFGAIAPSSAIIHNYHPHFLILANCEQKKLKKKSLTQQNENFSPFKHF